ncbi:MULTISPECIES: hypothetical protein [Streptomyces]|uniref:hypothetical protein n=1 Tax=Streptomyces TaxID=1883 RepID=UPI0012FEAADF|nr:MULTISPECIES: hypothetical protein [Streptomyces]MCW8220239.1 hypothetical protein [Streptomyces griseolus]
MLRDVGQRVDKRFRIRARLSQVQTAHGSLETGEHLVEASTVRQYLFLAVGRVP